MSKIFVLVFFLSCSSTPKNTGQQSAQSETSIETINTSSAPFNFKVPDETFVMSSQLYEISGLAYDNSSEEFLTHNDEAGKVFYLDENLKQTKSKRWGSKGDYEGIATKGDFIYFLKSNGKLYAYNQKTAKVQNINTKLNSNNETEGLCFDYKSENTLLLACKGAPLKVSSDTEDYKCIYSYNLSTQTLDTLPFITLKSKVLEDFTSTHQTHSLNSKQKSKLRNFAPSAIAVDPFSGDYYISSARGSLLIIYNQKKELKDIVFLNSKTIPQPEGLTFDSKGNFYIATEGQGRSGKIFKYLRHHK